MIQILKSKQFMRGVAVGVATLAVFEFAVKPAIKKVKGDK